MNVILLNVNAISGSTGKIVTNIKSELESIGHECLICYGANETYKGHGYKRICPEYERKINAIISRISGVLHGGFTPFSFYRFKSAIEQFKPDIVHIHCANGCIIDLFRTLEYLAKSNIKTVLTNHAEFFYTGGCGHAFDCEKWISGCNNCHVLKSRIGLDVSKTEWNKFKKAFDFFDKDKIIITSVSPWVLNRVIQSPFLSRFRNKVVLNGIDTNVFRVREVPKSVKTKLPLNKPIALHVTASFTTEQNSIKGGFWIRELAYRLPNVIFVVACSYKGLTENLPANLYIWGRTQTQDELAELYNAADVTVLTSKRETFSMIVAESLCCGTPVVGFKAGGPESIAIPKDSKFVNYGEIDLLARELYKMLFARIDRKRISKIANEKYSKASMVQHYLEIYDKLCLG